MPQWQHQIPTLADVYQARRRIAPYLARTPLLRPAALGAALGCTAYLKCDNLQPIGAFKVRGGINLIAALSDGERRRGVVTASSGNHGQSIAYAAQIFGVRAAIYVPEGANPFKVAAIRRMGAEVVHHGADFDDARLAAAERAERDGMRFVHAANEPLLIAGVGTAYLEVVEEVPDVDVIIAPVGGGSGVCGACIVAKAIDPRIQVIGVQAAGSAAAYQSWRAGEVRSVPAADTFAEGLAARVGFELPLAILRRHVDDIVVATDGEIRSAIVLLLETTHQLAEGAGAAATAAAWQLRDRLAGRRVALMLSGGNITVEMLREVIERVRASSLVTAELTGS
ncbi:MAG: threonine/serine dehydratase [Chloroflexi bacterium]|nr:threonine/serine dehydratase [Chloroflexota bacterium]